jgi:GNAT superfamily N-acetyltransferase
MRLNPFFKPQPAFRRLVKPLPIIQLTVKEEPFGSSFVAPNPWFSASAMVASGQWVARLSFGVSPLWDRIYVDGLHVESAFRGRNYASSLLMAIAKLNGVNGVLLPITALHEVESSWAFWDRLRQGSTPGLTVTMGVEVSEMDDEARRWKQQAT